MDTIDLAVLVQDADEDSPASDLFAEIRSLEHAPRVYYTYATDGGKEFAFVTSSKDVHLGLGRISRKGLGTLCCILEEEFTKPKPQVLLRIDPANRHALLVMRSPSPQESRVAYQVSPTN